MTPDSPDFRLLFEQSPEILVVLLPDSPRFTQVAATEARLHITQATRASTIGVGIFELFPDNPDDPNATGARNLRASLERVLATRAADTMAVQKYDIRAPDGSFQVKYWSPKNVPVLSAAGDVQYIIHRVEDVSELVAATELGDELRGREHTMQREVVARSHELSAAIGKLRDANAKLGELDAAKTAFFNNVSHEFRTPLTLMLGPLEDLLADTSAPLSTEQAGRARMALENALRLLKLVNALLDFARLEAGRVRASYVPTDLARVTAELVEMFRSATQKAGIELNVECPPSGEPAWIDREMWERVVPNLVSNAFKFTLAGEIFVRVFEEGERFVLEVSDTGSGIPADELPKVFERFHRVAGTSGRTHEGTGIGLSLVRELVELHGGRVSVESPPSGGGRFRTTFRVEIPKGFAHLPAEGVSERAIERPVGRDAAAYAVEAARWARTAADGGAAGEIDHGSAPAPVAAAAGERARVLIVDDNADLRDYLVYLLGNTYDTVTAGDGLEALAAVRSARPDIVVSDVMMPRMDGVELVRRLRAEPATSTLPVILLSARSGEEAAIEGLDSGCDDYLAKPFMARELLARVRTHLSLSQLRRAWSDELESSNRNLEAFSYSVSHDLRAPLRHIRGFSDLLSKETAASADASVRHHVKYIAEAAEQMSALIDGLLELGRVSRAPLAIERVDLSELADKAIAELRLASPERAVSTIVASELLADGDRRLLGAVIANLIGNAWKYSSKNPNAHIEVGRVPGQGSTFFVRDDGAGFDMKYAEELFEPFKRLHATEEFEGSGVGLATVRRVLARHGGKIWVEAAVGKGATFFFTLPPGVVSPRV